VSSLAKLAGGRCSATPVVAPSAGRGGVGVLGGWLLAVALGVLAGPAAALDVPFLAGHVNDRAGMLSPSARDRLEARLSAFEAEKGPQVVVLTVASLEGEAIEDYAHRVASTWKLGRQPVDDGVLFLIARDDRKLRIEVGYGVEGALPDITCRRILDEQVVPRLRGGKIDEAIEAGAEAMLAALAGEALPPPASPGERFELAPILIVLGMFVLVIGTFSWQAVTGPPAAAWILYPFLAPFYLIFPGAILGWRVGGYLALGWLVLFPILRLIARKAGWTQREWSGGGSTWRRGSSWGGGGWSAGGWRGSGSSGGGFSGGGGSFGGGGASSSW
jgi:uncharacterized protein